MKFMKQRKSALALFMATAVVGFLVFTAVQVQAAEYWKQKFSRFSAIAGDTLAVGDVVCIDSYYGRAYKADADLAGRKTAVGVIGQGGAAGATVEIVVSGILAGQTAASPGSRLFLSTTAGAFTTTYNDWGQNLGWVLPGPSTEPSRSTDYYIDVKPAGASSGATSG